MASLKNKSMLFSLLLATGLVVGVVFVLAEEPYDKGSEFINLSELSETDIDQMAAVLAEMQSARENIE